MFKVVLLLCRHAGAEPAWAAAGDGLFAAGRPDGVWERGLAGGGHAHCHALLRHRLQLLRGCASSPSPLTAYAHPLNALANPCSCMGEMLLAASISFYSEQHCLSVKARR